MTPARAFIAALIAIAAVAGTAGCGSAGSKSASQTSTTHASADEQTFTSKEYSFRVTLPRTWSETDASVKWDGNQLQGLASPAFANFTAPTAARELVVADAPAPKGADLPKWKAAMVSATPGVCGSPQSGRKTTLGGEPALAWTTRCSDGYDVNKIAALHHGLGYIAFLASRTANSDAKDRQMFESVRRSFRFTG
jgi:hypothetical protein